MSGADNLIFNNLYYTLNEQPFIPFITGVITSTQVSDIFCDQFNTDIREILETSNTNECHYIEDDCGKNDEFIMKYEFVKNELNSTYRFFFIKSAENTSAIILTYASSLMKLWINYKLFTIIQANSKLYTTKLHKGMNIVVVEIPKTKPSDYLFIRVSSYEHELINKELPCLLLGNLQTEDFGFIKHAGNHLYNNENFSFAFFPNHEVLEKRKTAELKITDNFTKEVLLQKRIKVRKKYDINLNGFNIENYDSGNSLVASVTYEYKNKKVHNDIIPLFTKPVHAMLDFICENAEKLLKEGDVTKFDRLCLKQGIEYIKKYGRELPAILAQASALRYNVKYITEGNHRDVTIYEPGIKRIFFFNNTYNAVNYYRIYLPTDYTEKIMYPLIIINSTFEYGDLGKYFTNYVTEHVIVADISGRGVLLGSYMGEAAISIALEDIFSRFSIDRTRVYCTGSSNGGGAAWALLEAYPHLFAGALVVSGQPNHDLICNLGNIKIIYLSSLTDRMYNIGYKKVEEKLKDHPDSRGVLGLYYCHNSLRNLWLNNYLFDMLLTARNNPYPYHIQYKTLRNRHRKTYWLEIHSIENGETKGSISADVADALISVRCKGITGFTITIPPQVNREYFEVIVNERDNFVFESFNEDKIHFVKSVSEEETYFQRKLNYAPIIDLHKGNGLLDVYLDPLSIVVPNDSPKFINDVANAYSEPYCNGFIPKIYIKYPIVTYEELFKAEDIAERSYVVIDDESEHPLLEEIRSRANIKTSWDGWTYKDKFHNGSYCIHQIVNSPWNPARNIHLISFNDKDILRKNLYTRKVIIPTYANGWHPYWNNDALVFDGKKYFGILDYSADPKTI